MTALILSVGGTPEPLVKSIRDHSPGVVCFLVSQRTIPTIGRVAQDIADVWPRLRVRTEVIEDGEDLVQAYEAALRCGAWGEQVVGSPDQVVVDYTGGTKAMAAGLTLASVGRGYRFSYIGGTERDRAGTGVVINGAEVVRITQDPWAIYAVEERKRIAQFFSSFHFEAALIATTDLETRWRQRPVDRRQAEVLSQIIRSYLEWDRFNHLEALRQLGPGLRKLRELVEVGRSSWNLAPLVEPIQANVAFLQALQRDSRGFKEECPAFVRDLVANADRRAKQGRYDDAVARLYRATEMVAQAGFRRPPLECSTSEVPEEKIPEALRIEFRLRYSKSSGGVCELPVRAAFRVLAEIGTDEGRRFVGNERRFIELMSARNGSIGAHGTRPVSRDAFDGFRRFLVDAFDLTDFPKFPPLTF